MYQSLVKSIPNGIKLGLEIGFKFAMKPTNSYRKATDDQSQLL